MRDRLLFAGVLIVLLWGISSCQRTLADRYSEDELVEIMFDAHTLGLIYNRQDERTDSLQEAYYKVIESRYGIDQDEFQKLVEGLILNAELYDRVYNRLARKAEQMEQRVMQDY